MHKQTQQAEGKGVSCLIKTCIVSGWSGDWVLTDAMCREEKGENYSSNTEATQTAEPSLDICTMFHTFIQFFENQVPSDTMQETHHGVLIKSLFLSCDL